MKVTNNFLLFLPLLLMGAVSQAQEGQLSILSGSSELIVSSYYDRDSFQLFTLDKRGFVVVWDVKNMLPIKRFATVPSFPFVNDSKQSYNFQEPAIEVNSGTFWISYQSRFGSYQYTTDVYSRRDGAFRGQTDTANIHRIAYLKDNAFINAACAEKPFFENGKVIYGALFLQQAGGKEAKSVPLDNIVSQIKVSPDERMVAVGYRFGGVDVFSLPDLKKVYSYPRDSTAIGEVNLVSFLPNSRGVLYTYKASRKPHVYLHYFDKSLPAGISLPDGSSVVTGMEVAPSGNFAAFVLMGREIWVYDLRKGHVAHSKPLQYVNDISGIHFLNDSILLVSGSEMWQNEGVYSMSRGGSSLKKLDWPNGLWSANFSLDPQQETFFTADLKVLNDSIFQLRHKNEWVHNLTPKTLKNEFVRSSELSFSLLEEVLDRNYSTGFHTYQGLLTNDADPAHVYGIYPIEKDHSLVLRKDPETGRYSDPVEVKNFPDLKPYKIHTGSGTLVWGKDDNFGNVPIIIADLKGKILYQDSLNYFQIGSFAFSPDGKWASYQRNAAEIVVVNLVNTRDRRSINTGFDERGLFDASLFFSTNSDQLIYEPATYQGQPFALLSYKLESRKTDTLFRVGVKPYSYALDKDLKRIALSFPVNFADTSFFAVPEKVAHAARYNFRTVYRPTVFVMDMNGNALQTFSTTGNQKAEKLALSGNQFIALQQDGRLYYYDLEDPSATVAHYLKGKDHILLDRNTYFATPGVREQLLISNGSSYRPVGHLDVLYNKPHEILRRFNSRNVATIELYQKAYEKRKRQFASLPANVSLLANTSLSVTEHSGASLLVRDSVVKLTINTGSKTGGIQRLFIKVNDIPLYGSNGYAIKPGSAKVTLTVPLDSGYNKVTVYGVDTGNQPSLPLQFNYYADYKPVRVPRRLWVIAAGVSNYADSLNNLKYAAKDASDIARVFQFKEFDTSYISTLFNEQVTEAAVIERLRNFKVEKNDVVVVYLAGHGLLDKDANFYFATYDINFKKPEERGLSYQKLLNTLDELSCREKMLFLDACHSGLVDRSLVVNNDHPKASDARSLVKQATRGAVPLNTASQKPKERDVFLFMQQVFSDLSVDHNVDVLAASLGNSYALENSQLQNGLFTYALIKGLGLAKAAPRSLYPDTSMEREYAEQSVINIKDLGDYVNREVVKLSRGSQIPSFKIRPNSYKSVVFAEGSFPAYLYNSFDEQATEYKRFLDRYKEKNQ